MNRALGIDLSFWDLRPLEWRSASEALSFAFIKISQGISGDSLYRAQWAAAEGWVLRGIYHMLDPEDDLDSSVDNTLEIYKSVTPGELPPALDLELGNVRTELPRARRWLERWRNKTGVRPIIYTGMGFLNLEQEKPENRWLSEYPLWLSQYPYDNMSEDARRDRLNQIMRGDFLLPYPTARRPWVTPPDWYQWTGKGDPASIPGYYAGIWGKKAVDLNFYNGTEEDLFLRYGKPRKRENGAPNMPSPYKFSFTPTRSTGSKVRQDHYVVDSPITNQIGSLKFGRFAFGNEVWISPAGASFDQAVEYWLRVVSVDGVPYDGWMAGKHKSGIYGTIAPIGEGEPETPPQEMSSLSVQVTAGETASGLEVDLSVSSPGYTPRSAKVTLPREL